MAYISIGRSGRRQASDFERILCVTTICALAAAPLAICVAVAIWGR